MSTEKNEKKEKKADPITEQSGGKTKNSANTPSDVEAKKESKEDKTMSNTAKELQKNPGQEKEENQPIFIGIGENFSENDDFFVIST